MIGQELWIDGLGAVPPLRRRQARFWPGRFTDVEVGVDDDGPGIDVEPAQGPDRDE